LNDRKNLYLIAEGRRVKKEKYKDYEENCYDIFFPESNDEGEKWSESILIPRKNVHDKENRHNPTLIVTN
jgi:hypothetical protein